MSDLKPCPFCGGSSLSHKKDCYISLYERSGDPKNKRDLAITDEEVEIAFNNRPTEEELRHTVSKLQSEINILRHRDKSRPNENKIKAEAVREATNYILGDAGLTDYYNQFIDRANKLEEGGL